VLRRFYAASDVFVSTPWYEPFGITPLEAMACAIPVVGSAVGGIQYTVVPGVTGHLVPPKDPQALAERLLDLHDSPSLARAMGRAGLEHVRHAFTWRRIGSEMSSALMALRPSGRRARTHVDRGAASPTGGTNLGNRGTGVPSNHGSNLSFGG
jgi:D-inositol-3-phosphate glycosyltransferase